MKKLEFLRLTEKISKGIASDEEIRLYNTYYNFFQNTPLAWNKQLLGDQDEIGQALFIQLKEKISKPNRIHRISLPYIAAAASILLGLFVGAYFIIHKPSTQQTAQIHKQTIPPGGNKAILTLANGQKIILTGAKNGLLANQGSTTINKTADGQVVYDASKFENKEIQYNTMTTPRGGQYHLVLADGTAVWLNAASSIKYPTAFIGKDRQVEITGEAYFQVAHNKVKPFRVITQGQTVEVLGTHFNINAYAEEHEVKTTLLEGSVKVSSKTGSVVIRPNEAAIMTPQSLNLRKADTEEAVAWKNGYFRFNGERIESIMRKLEHWYNIDVSYDHVTDEVFFGTISRFKNIDEVLTMLEATQSVHFKIEGRRITVMN